jgi:hypothetical protein
MKTNFLLLLVLVSTLVGGCTVRTGSQFTPVISQPDDLATVYIYRPYRYFNSGGFPYIFVNGEKRFPLPMRGYRAVNLPLGEHEIKAEGSTLGTNWYPGVSTFSLQVEAGMEYYLRVTPWVPPGTAPISFFTKAQTIIENIPKTEALPEIYETKEVL